MSSLPPSSALDADVSNVTLANPDFSVPFVILAADDAGHGDTHEGSTGYANDGHGAEGSFPPFDSSTYASQLLWLAITFGALYYIISRIAGPRIAAILETRRDRIAADMDTAAQMKAEADEAAAAYEQALAEARSSAMSIAAETRDSINTKIEAKRAEAEADAQSKLDEAEARITKMKDEALAKVDEIATDTTEALVGSLLGETISRDEIAGAVSGAVQK